MKGQIFQHKCQCGRWAEIYAMDTCAGGWGGYFCLSCKPHGWQITDYLTYGATS